MAARLLSLFVFSLLLLGTTCAQYRSVFVQGKIFFVDADCYSRMTRVEHVLAHPFTRIAHHDFENYPRGIDTHTTAPMDWAIATLATLFKPFTARSLDLAGAWISPLLGLATLLALWLWAGRIRLPYQNAMLLGLAVSPMISQAFKLGRPDHQSLLLFLLAIGLAAEHRLWSAPSRRSAIAWGLAWGLALWTSLYEPLILFALLLIVRPFFLRRSLLSRPWAVAAGTAVAVFGIGILFDGWRVEEPSPVVLKYFPLWSRSIAELAHLSSLSSQFFGWFGWLVPLLPLALAWRWLRGKQTAAALFLVFVLATYGLTCWQIRWGSYLALFVAMAFPFALAIIPQAGLAWAAFGISLWPIASQWDAMLFPDPQAEEAVEENRSDYLLLRQVAEALVSETKTPILAPWWLSPPLAYWSGQPCVAGSSHQSLPGIVDTARFYTAEDPAAARDILERRDVRYVVAYEPSRVLSTSGTVLGEPAPFRPLIDTLYNAPQLAPDFLKLVFANQYYRVYEFVSAKRPAANSD